MASQAENMQAHKHSHKHYKGLLGWLTTVDHKKIGVLYLSGGFLFFIMGGLEATLIRIQLLWPMNDFVSADTYNELLTMHGTTMMFLAALPLLFGLMNVIIPLQIGARDVAFPFVNALGLWLFLAGGVLLNISWFSGSVPDAGWTSYVPLAGTTYNSGHGVDYYVLGLQVAGLGTLLSGINFLTTIINMRAPGMSFMRLPLFTWAGFVSSVMIVFAFPVLTVGLFALMFDRLFQTNFFEVGTGGNTVLWEHLFWVFGHPEVYILILPAFGIISDVVSTFSKKPLFGYSSMVFALLLIAFLGFMVWIHHMFAVGLGPIANSIFSISTMLIAVPTGMKVFNWLFTLWGGSIRYTAANLYAIGFIPTFVMGGVTGVMLGVPPADYQYHDTYFVVAHFHYVLVGGMVLAIFSGVHFWWPKIFGRMLNEGLGKVTFWIFITGFHLTFFFQHFLGLLGMPRRVWTYLPNQGYDTMNFISTLGAILMGVGTIAMFINVIITSRMPRNAQADPWEDGRTLEWSIASPPPEYNFKQLPLVRSLDAWWREKQDGHSSMTPAEPAGPIHMPSPSILPLIMSIGLFLAGYGFIYDHLWLEAGGILLTLVCMILRSVFDDHGYHIELEEQN